MFNSKKQTPLTFRSLVIDEAIDFANLCKQTFRETYQQAFSESDLERIFGKQYLQEDLPSELNSNDTVYTLACLDDVVAGYSKLKCLDKKEVVLDKLYFLKKYQGRGYGTALLIENCRKALQHNKEIIRLNVWEKNASAVSFYRDKCHFEEVGKIELLFGDKVFYDYMMISNITELLIRLELYSKPKLNFKC